MPFKIASDPDDDNKIMACDACESEVPTDLFPNRRRPKEDVRLCEVCASTVLGINYHYPEHMNISYLIRMLAACN